MGERVTTVCPETAGTIAARAEMPAGKSAIDGGFTTGRRPNANPEVVGAVATYPMASGPGPPLDAAVAP